MTFHRNHINNKKLSLIPKPQQLRFLEGYLAVSDVVAITANDDSLGFCVQWLCSQWRSITGIKLDSGQYNKTAVLQNDTADKNQSPVGESLKIALNLKAHEKIKQDAYELIVERNGITVNAQSVGGVFYALQTLLQAVRSVCVGDRLPPLLPLLSVKDSPRCEYRGLHLDVSRHFRTVDEIKQVLDLMAEFKLNYFHWHLVDDQGWRLQINKYPALTKIGAIRDSTVVGHTLDRDADVDGVPHAGFYTQAQIRDIVDYAVQRHITVIPEIDLPGHSSALISAYPELACQHSGAPATVKTHFGIFHHVLCNREATFEFLSDIFKEVAELFPGRYVHIGGDEVKKDHWQQCGDCQAVIAQKQLANVDALHGYFIARCVEILEGLDKEVICWDDVLSADNLPSSVTIMSWLGEDSATRALERGHKVIMTQNNLYFDFYQSMSVDEPMAIHGHSPLSQVYQNDPLKNDQRIVGAQANVWSEYIKTTQDLHYVLLPRLCALSEILWTNQTQQNWEGFKQRIRNQLGLFEQREFCASDSIFVPEFETTSNTRGYFEVGLTKAFDDIEILYTLDGTRPESDAKRYLCPLKIEHPTVIHARCWDKRSNKLYKVNRLALNPHLAMYCPVTIVDHEGRAVDVDNLRVLSNGFTQQGQRFQHSNWVLIDGLRECQVAVDLLKVKAISSVSLGFDGALGRKLYFPEWVEILTSEDGVQWQSQGRVTHDEVSGRCTSEFDVVGVQYVKAVIQNGPDIYCHESESKIVPPLYIDEVVIG